ncbi:MAG TPA: hypothetical protein VLG47_05985 [Candidatus Saccharimonadales bacterium]|nr:hypothetical protein [Candidatus Saccharimonadales bacterium]
MGDITGGLQGPRLPDDFRIWRDTKIQIGIYAPQIVMDTADNCAAEINLADEVTDRSELITAVFMNAALELNGHSANELLSRYRVLKIGQLLVAKELNIRFNISTPRICLEFMEAITKLAKVNARTSRSELLAAAFMLSSVEMDSELGCSILRRYRNVTATKIEPVLQLAADL